MIRAIEKCSLQATFGPGITSTGGLLTETSDEISDASSDITIKASHYTGLNPKTSDASSDVTIKASQYTGLNPKISDVSSDVTLKASRFTGLSPVKKHVRSNKFSKSRTNTGLLPKNPTKKGGKTPSDPTMNHDIPLDLTNECGNIPYDLTTSSRGMPAFPPHKDGMKPVQQCNFLGRVPLETWGRKASYHARTTLSVSFANNVLYWQVEELRHQTGRQRILRNIHDLLYSNHKHPNHDRLWDSKNLFCIGCNKDTMAICDTCGRYCCLWSTCKQIADAPPNAGTLPQERVEASRWLRKIAGLMSYGIDEPTFLKCFRCRKVLCPKCTSICEICDALSCSDCCGRCPRCRVPKCVRCQPKREEECSYHRGPPAI